MTHLSVEEMIDFVSFEKLTEENIALAKKVNEHICSCKECFQKVSAFQTVSPRPNDGTGMKTLQETPLLPPVYYGQKQQQVSAAEYPDLCGVSAEPEANHAP